MDGLEQAGIGANCRLVIRLIINADSNVATTADRGELVFDWAYQGLGSTLSATTGSPGSIRSGSIATVGLR